MISKLYAIFSLPFVKNLIKLKAKQKVKSFRKQLKLLLQFFFLIIRNPMINTILGNRINKTNLISGHKRLANMEQLASLQPTDLIEKDNAVAC